MAFRDTLKKYRESQNYQPSTSNASPTNFSDTTKSFTSGSSGSEDSGSFRDKLKRYRESQATVSLQGWATVSNDLLDEVQQYYGSWRSRDDKQHISIQDRVSSLLAQADGWRKKYAGDDNAIKSIDSVVSSLSELKDYANNYRSYYGQWDTVDDFNAYWEQLEDYHGKRKFDIQAGQKEISELEKFLEESKVTGKSYEGLTTKELENLISQKKQYLNQAKHIQKGHTLAGVADNDDFDQHSGYKTTIKEKPSWWENGVGDTQYEWINNQNGFRDEYERSNADLSAKAGASSQSGVYLGPRESLYKEMGYDHLTESEIAIYNYYYAKDGKEKAQEYLDNIQETLNYRKATEMYSDLEGQTALELIFGVDAGLDQFKSGLYSAFNTEDDYIAQSAYQIASGMVREDLADDGFKLPDFLGGASLGQAGYDLVTTSANMAPSMLASVGIGLINPLAGEIAGNALMGVSAAGNAYQDALNRGYDKDQARLYSSLIGGSEAILGQLLGGISKLGGTGKVVTNMLNGVDNAFLRFVAKMGGSMISEGFEEGLQEVLAPMFENLIMHTDKDINWSEVAYSALLGAVTAGVMEGPGTIAGEVNTYRSGRQLQKADVTAQRLAEIGKTFSADTVAHQLAGRVNDKTGAYTMGRLFNEIGATLTEQNVNDITYRLMAKSMPENIARKNAEVFADVVEGGSFTEGQIAVIEANEILASTVRETLIDENSTVMQRNKGYNEVLMALAQEKAAHKASRTKETAPGQKKASASNTVDTEIKSGTETASEPSAPHEVQETTEIPETATPVKARSISTIKDGHVTIKMEDGSEVNLQDADIDPNDSVRIETIASIEGISTQDANFILGTLEMSPGASAQMESLGAKEAYKYGFYGFSQDHMTTHGVFANSLTGSQRNAIYQTGQNARTRQVAAKQATVRENRTTEKSSVTGKVHFDGDRSRLTERQSASLSTLETVAEALGVQIHVFESEVNERGKHIGANGWYDPKDSSIHIDLHAGANGEGTMLFTAAHELTHHIRKWSPEKFKTLADFLVQEYGKKGVNVDALVREQMAKAKRNGRTISYDTAYEEVVADSMETMLSDGKVVEKLAKLKQKDESLWQKIKDFISELAVKIRKVYEGLTPDSVEGRYVAEMVDSIEKLQDLFAEALVDASENYQASLTPGEEGVVVNQSGDPVAYSTENGSVMLSMRTYDEEGRKAFRNYLQKCVTNKSLTKAEMQEMMDGIEEIYQTCKEFKDKYAPFSAWSDAAVVRDTRGKPVFSVVTPNGDYKMNLDFSLVCKKRRTLDAVFNEMSRRGIIDDFELGQKSVVKINEIIRRYGLETACALCFVDAKRFRQASMADQFTSLYNELVESLVPEDQKGSIDHFNFSGYATIKKVEGGIDTWANSKLDFSHINHVLKTYGDGTVEYKAAKYIKNNPKGRKLLLRGDFMSSQGFDAVKSQNQDILKLYNSKKGTGGPKAAFGDVQYMNEVIQKARWWTPAKAYAVGGIRIQSFSDYVPRMVFDYTQMIYDLAATKLPAHAYTKEALFVKQFGLTGVKINMSLIPAIAEGGIAPGLDANGDYVWAGESFDFETAKEIQNAEGYTENCGTICVGVSDRHIRKLLSDPDIRMVIPYHKSGLNPIVAHMNKIAEFTDYTNKQNTTVKETGSKAEKHFDFNEALHKMGENADPKAVIQQYFDWCDDNGYEPKFAEFRDHPNYYKLIEDFTLYDKDGKYVPQREVRAVFPKADSAFGSMKELIREGLQEDAVVEGKRDKNLSAIVDEIQRTIPKTEAEIAEEQVAQADRDLEATENFHSDVLYSERVTDKETLNFLNKQETITTYKTMQIVDGKLYPPMAARTNGAYEDYSELGAWEQATEHPELIKNGNKFKLDKGKGQGSIEAAYNPYMHSSNLVLNDQFSGAYTRDNLVTVECEVPMSELTSGYHAQYAKDSVGWHAWHTGTVAGSLRKARGIERQVFLSRWIKPVRIVPDSEVASMYRDLLDGTDIAVPDNVVTPSLLKELKNAGVKIKESGRVKYSDRDFTYQELTTKSDLKGRVIRANKTVKLTSNGSIDKAWVVSQVLRQCDSIQTKAPTPTYFVNVPDIGKNVEITSTGIKHGFIKSEAKNGKPVPPKALLNARVSLDLPQILRNSIEVNQSDRGDNAEVEFSHILIGVTALEAPNGNIEYYAVRSVVEARKNQGAILTEANVIGKLHAMNAKKIGKPQAQVGTNSTVALTSSSLFDYSVANLLNDVKSEFDDTFSNDVYKHFGMTRNANSFSQYLKYSDRDTAPTFYSNMAKVVDGVKQEKLGAASVVNMLRGKGVKAEEIKWSGIEAWLEGKKSVTKAELQEFIAGSMLQIEEEQSSTSSVALRFKGNDTYKLYDADGNVLDTFIYNDFMGGYISEKTDEIYSYTYEIEDAVREEYGSQSLPRWSDYKLDGGSNYREIVFKLPNNSYSNQAMRIHWGDDAEGILAHARIQDFNVYGKKMLFIEELQSDYHNEGHESGYADSKTEKKIEALKAVAEEKFFALEDYSTEMTGVAGEWEEVEKTVKGARLLLEYNEAQNAYDQAMNEFVKKIPDAPFKDTYHEYVMKRLIRMAAEQGYDSIGWTPAEIQVKRWSEEFAEGYRIEYDQDIPKFMNKYGKKWGAKVSKMDIQTKQLSLEQEADLIMMADILEDSESYIRDGRGIVEAWTMPITDSMKQSVLTEGQPLYQARPTESVSNRSLLANAFESVAQNDIERSKIQEYKSKISLINDEEKKLRELNEQIKELSFAKGPKDTNAIRDLQFEAKQTANRISTYDKQLLRLEASKPLQDVLTREKRMAYQRAEKKGKEALEAYREKATKTQRELINRYQESRKRGIESREKTAMRHKIKDVVNDLNQYLLKGTKDRHVPIGLQKAVAEALNAVNMDTVGAEERIAKLEAELMKAKTPEEIREISKKIDHIREMGDKMSGKLKRLKEAYDDFINSDDPLIANAHDDGLSAHMMTLIVRVGDTPLRDMSLSQLQDVYDVYKMVLATVRNANKSFADSKKQEISTRANQVMVEIEKVGGTRGKRFPGQDGVSKFYWDNLKPVYAFEHIGSTTLTKAFNNVRAGEDVWALDITEAREYYLERYRKYNYESWDFDKRYKFESASGLSFELTLDQIMSLYAFSKRDQAGDHLKYGGFVFDPKTEVVEKTKSGIKVKYNVANATTYNLSEETLSNIIGMLNGEQKSFVDEMQDYLSTVMGAKGNEVSLAMYDIKLFREKHYFPLKSAHQYMARAKEQAQGEVKVKNSGFSKETKPHAKNPIVLSSFMDVWANHVNEMSMYHAFVLPMEDFYRIYNYTTPSNNPSMPVEGVTAFLENAYGRASTDYIDQMLKDLNGGARTDPRTGFINKAMGLFKKGAVFASASVVVQQPSAIARATALVETKYFIGPKVDHKRHAALWDEVKQYAPVAIIKEMGYFDTNMGKSTQDFIMGKEYNGGIKEKAKAMMTDSNYRDEVLSKAPALADEIAWCAIWEAVKRETRAKNPGMDVKSEEFLTKAGNRFTEVITKTQVYDSVLSRSANMRSKDTGMKMATAFMAEPTTSINMISDALLKGKRGDRKTARAAIGSVLAAQILNSFLVAWVYAARDDDEDESFAEKYLSSFVSGIVDGVNPATYIPFIKDIVSIVQGYDVERSDMAVISDLWKACQNLTKENISAWSKVEGFVGNICQIFGLPVKNIMRDVRSVYQAYNTIVNGENTTMAGIGYAIKGGITGKTVSKGQQLYDAYLRGDQAHSERVKGRFKDESAEKTAIRSVIQERFESGEIDTDTAQDQLVEYGGFDEDKAYWKTEEWSFEAENDDEEFDKYNKFYEAVQTGKNLKAVIQEYTDRGVKLSTLKSKISTYFKPLYTEMSNSEKAGIKGYLLNALEQCGYDRSDAEAKIAEWEYEANHPELDGKISFSEYKRWETDGKPRGVSIELFTDVSSYRDDGTSGSVKSQEEVAAYIDSLSISTAQKDALWCCFWKESTLKKAPWH